MSFLTKSILNLSPPLALALVFLFPALEASIFLGFIFPGETAVILGGVLAFEHKLPLWLVMVVASLGAVIGDSVGYFVGAKFGHRILERASGRFVKPKRVHQVTEFVSKRGVLGVVVGRFTTILRVLVPGVAGMSEMPYVKFLIANIVGGVGWAVLYSYLGYTAGTSFAAVEKTAGTTGVVVFVAVAAVVGLYFLYRYAREFAKEK